MYFTQMINITLYCHNGFCLWQPSLNGLSSQRKATISTIWNIIPNIFCKTIILSNRTQIIIETVLWKEV